MSRKTTLIIAGVIGGMALIGGGVGVAAYLNTRNSQPQTAGSGQFDSNVMGQTFFNRGNFSSVNGKVIQITTTDMIVDQTSGQALLGWDAQTQVRKISASTKDKVAVAGNYVAIRYKDNGGVMTATTVSRIDQADLTQGLRGFGPSGAPRPSGGARMFRGLGGQGFRPNFTPSADFQRTIFGKIDSVQDNKITIIGPDGTTKTDVDISSATFDLTSKAAISDIHQGDTIQANGAKSADSKIIARVITIELPTQANT